MSACVASSISNFRCRTCLLYLPYLHAKFQVQGPLGFREREALPIAIAEERNKNTEKSQERRLNRTLRSSVVTETHSIDNEYGVSIRKHFNDTFLALHYRYSRLLARAYLHNQTHDKNFKNITEIGMKRAFWLCKYLNFDKMQRMGGLSREGHICA